MTAHALIEMSAVDALIDRLVESDRIICDLHALINAMADPDPSVEPDSIPPESVDAIIEAACSIVERHTSTPGENQ